MKQRQYIAIDLKSFYASVECVERNLDPLDTCLTVADSTRTDKTICLAVSPALKAFGTGGRPRLFELKQKVRDANIQRHMRARAAGPRATSYSARELAQHPELDIDFITATPRMQLYLDYSARIYSIYLRFIAPEDIHVYSIDEVFIDATAYLDTYRTTAHELAITMIRAVLSETGITATAGIGTNLYLCKVAMDIVAKKMPADKDGVRIAELNQRSYRDRLWDHRPLTDFWRVGSGIARKLEQHGMLTMGDVARMSITNEDWFYKQFGVNAELLIDHAWGWEPVTMPLIKSYRPETHSISSGQVLQEPYPADKALVVLMEMADCVALELTDKRLLTDQLCLTIGYDRENLQNDAIASQYHGRIHIDHYGRPIPYHAHGTANLGGHTASGKALTDAVAALFHRIVDKRLLIRRLNISANHLISPRNNAADQGIIELELFSDYEALDKNEADKRKFNEKEHRRQSTVVALRHKFGKNIILKGINFMEGATQRERNRQIGGHKA